MNRLVCLPWMLWTSSSLLCAEVFISNCRLCGKSFLEPNRPIVLKRVIHAWLRFFRILFEGALLAGAWVHLHAADPEATANKNLSADQILERVRSVMETDTQTESLAHFTYLRKAVILDLDEDGSVDKQTIKTYRAFTDGRDQQLLEIDGRPATEKEQQHDRAHNLDRQQRFLHRQTKEASGDNDQLMAKNMDLFRKKFRARRMGEGRVDGRPCHILELIPRPEYELESSVVDRFMNAVQSKIWVDSEDYRIARLEVLLQHPVSFLGGLAGVIRSIQLRVDQQRLASGMWVDEKIRAMFDVRILFKTYRFNMTSTSFDFEPIPVEATNPP